MKRIGLVGVGLTLLVIMTGCGNTKELTCTNEENGAGASMVLEYVWKDDVLTKVGQEIMLEVEDDYVDDIDYYVDSLEEESKGIKADYTLNGNRLTMKVEYELGAMTDEELDDFGFDPEEDNSYETIKKELEEDGYVCE